MILALLVAGLVASPISPPRPIDPGSWFTAFSYPPEAAKQRVQGEVGFEVDVDAAGKPTACHITSSSGSPLLDQPTCAIIMANARFRPARDANGSAMPGQYANKTVWQLHVEHGPRWTVAIVDLSDPKHPTCTDHTKGGSLVALNCAFVLRQSAILADLAKTMTKVAYFSSLAFGDDEPYGGDPSWGERLSFSEHDEYVLGTRSDCVAVAVAGVDAGKGLSVGKDPCAGSGKGRKLGLSMRPRAQKTRHLVAVFGVRRKDGQAAAASN